MNSILEGFLCSSRNTSPYLRRSDCKLNEKKMPSWTCCMHIMQKEIADMAKWKNVSLPRRRHRFDYCHPQSSNSCAKKLMAIISLNLTTWFATSLHLAYQFIVSFSINFGSFQFLNPRYLPSFFWPHPLTKYLIHQYKELHFLSKPLAILLLEKRKNLEL